MAESCSEFPLILDDFYIDPDHIEIDAQPLLLKLNPEWHTERIRTKEFTDGITNKLVGFYCESEKDKMVLIRIHGEKTELLIDREAELNTIRILQANGTGSKLYCKFQNGLAYEYLPGQALDEHLVRDPTVARLIADGLAKMHCIKTEDENPQSPLFVKLRRLVGLIPASFGDETKDAKFNEFKATMNLEEELDLMERELTALGSPVVFCHNDLLCKNIIYDEQSGKLHFIDYEYAGFNYQAFDIGNHFDEYAGVSVVDYSRYPDREYQMSWLRTYLECWFERSGREKSEVTEHDVERLYVQTNKFSLIANLFWGLWAFIQARFSTIDFDFLNYGIMRLQEYSRKKKQFLELKMI